MISEKEKGVSLVITFFIMIIILAVVLSVSIILYSEVKIIRNIGNSVISLYAADSGVEKVLYYDSQVKPILEDDKVAVRGLCSVYPYGPAENPNGCPKNSDISGLDSSIYCNPNPYYELPTPGVFDGIYGCDPDVCDDCKISFNTDLNSKTNYSVTSWVSTSVDESTGREYTDLYIRSKGVFGGASRQIEIKLAAPQTQGAINIANACANPKSTAQGLQIKISAVISTIAIGDTIDGDRVTARIYYYNSSGDVVTVASNLHLVPLNGNYIFDTWEYNWNSGSSIPHTYYVDLDVFDTLDPPSEATLIKMPPCGMGS